MHKDLARFGPIWTTLPYDICSGDESDDGQAGEGPYYSVTTLPWRSHSFTDWCAPFDTVSLLNHYKSDGRRKRGNLPRPRQRGGRQVDQRSEPVKGLPLNFYNDAWLDALHEDAREALGIQPPIDLTHTADVLR